VAAKEADTHFYPSMKAGADDYLKRSAITCPILTDEPK